MTSPGANHSDASPAQTAPAKRRRPRWLILLGLALIVLSLGSYLINAIPRWKDRFAPRRLRTVEPGLIYASGQIDRHLLRDLLIDKKIQVVICLLGNEPNDPDVDEERKDEADLHIQRCYYPLSGDGTGPIANYAGAVAKMVQCWKLGEPALVHCSSGVQRTNGAVYYFRVLVQHRSAAEAMAEMESNGFDAGQNPQLVPYLNSHVEEMARLLVAQGVIDRIPQPLPRIPQ